MIMKKYEITKAQIETLSKTDHGDTKIKLKEWFPTAFNLEYGKWYKSINGVLKFFVTNETAYGFNSEGQWSDLNDGYDLNDLDESRVGFSFKWSEASKQEVEQSLSREASKRGFKEGVWFILPSSKTISLCGRTTMLNDRNTQILYFGDYCVFKDGLWGEVLTTLTLKQAEEKLNCKIID